VKDQFSAQYGGVPGDVPVPVPPATWLAYFEENE
jgi:hypothetical protein